MNPPPPKVLLEVCIASADDAVHAVRGGADRLELNSALELGGLTPSLGSILEAKASVTAPIIVMIRPRPGGFTYSDADFRTIKRDLDLSLNHGADGVALGVLNSDGSIDVKRCAELANLTAQTGKPCVFHRAFDLTPDPLLALEQLIDLGFTRIMTSGQQESAYHGIPLIAKLITHAKDRIEILPAGGIQRFTIDDILARTGCNQVHASLRTTLFDSSAAHRPSISFGKSFKVPETSYDATNPQAVSDLVQRLVSNSATPKS